MSAPSLASILAARERLAGQVHVTPIAGSRTLADRTGTASFGLKCESLQKTGSFKARGAFNALSQLDPAARARGVVAVSAGNHAQGVAWASAALQIRCTVVMPATASETKAVASAGYGATVIRHGTSPEAFAKARELAAEHGFTMIHPFDDLNVITGAASVGVEIVEHCPDVEMIVVPIGGGGLISGVAAAVRQLQPSVSIIGVEPEGASTMRQSLDAGHPQHTDRPHTMADGLASPYAGELTFPIVRDLVDDVVIVTDAEIEAAIPLILSRMKLLAEGAGAAATAALLSGKIPSARGRRVIAVLSGGNIDLERLRTLI